MPTMHEQMTSAKAYIQLKQWDDARRILRRVDHPKAKQWLQRIDEIAPSKPEWAGIPEEYLWIGLVLLVGSIIVSSVLLSIMRPIVVNFEVSYFATWCVLTVCLFISSFYLWKR
jgi:hypothetical protein